MSLTLRPDTHLFPAPKRLTCCCLNWSVGCSTPAGESEYVSVTLVVHYPKYSPPSIRQSLSSESSCIRYPELVVRMRLTKMKQDRPGHLLPTIPAKLSERRSVESVEIASSGLYTLCDKIRLLLFARPQSISGKLWCTILHELVRSEWPAHNLLTSSKICFVVREILVTLIDHIVSLLAEGEDQREVRYFFNEMDCHLTPV